MASKTASPAQVAARAKFADMARGKSAAKKNGVFTAVSNAPTLKVLKVTAIVLAVAALTTGTYLLGKYLYDKYLKNPSDDTPEKAEADVHKFINEGQVASYPASQYNSFADTIYESLAYSAVSDNHQNVIDTCAQMQSSLDVALTIVAFGTRQEYFFGLPTGDKKSLFQFISSQSFSGGMISAINEGWTQKNITYRIS